MSAPLTTWRYKEGATGHDPGFEAPAFDDSSWAIGNQPFGLNDLSDNGPINTPWLGPSNDLCLRAHLDISADVVAVALHVTIDFSGTVYVNGASVGTVAVTDLPYKVLSLSSWNVGDNVIAIRAHADLQQNRAAIAVAMTPPAAVGWDAYAAADPNGPTLAELDDATARSVRVALNEPGSGTFKINRYSPVATEAIVADGNVVKCRFPWRDDYDFAFLLEKGDFTLAAADEKGGEEFTFGGRGILAYLDRAIMDAVAYTTGFDVTQRFDELWHASVPTPTGVAFLPADPTHVYIISARTRRIYKVSQATHKIVGTSPVLWSGSDNYAAGLTADPSNAAIMWALEAPWGLGGSGNTKIRKIDISGAIGTWNVSNTYDLGSALHLSDIRASTASLITTQYATGKIQKRSKVTPGTVTADYTVTYKGVAQTHPNGAAVSENGNGTEIAMWFGGTGAGGVKRALVANLSNPSVVTRTIDTEDIASFGGDWSLESGQTYFYMVSYTLGRLWKYQLTASTPHDPVDGIWRLDEEDPGAILWRIIREAQATARPQHPIPDLTYDFTQSLDSAGDAWDHHDGTKEFDARIGDSVLKTALRLLPYGLVEQMTPYLRLIARNASSYGDDRTGSSFGAGVVRFEKGVNIVPELGRQSRERAVHSDMLAVGKGNLYARATLAGLGYVREGFVGTDLADATALEGTAEAALADERVKSERIRFKVVRGDDVNAGLYLPFTHYNVGDLVTLHTGSGEHDFTNETFILYAITLDEGAVGDFPTPILELGSATVVDAPPASTGGGGGGGNGSSVGGGSTTIVQSSDVTVQGTNDAGVVVTSAFGRTIRSSAWQVYQRGAGLIEVVLAAANRLLGLDDVDADGILDGQTLVWDEASATFVPGDIGALGPYVLVASQNGCVLDSDLETGGGTDDTAALQALLDVASADGRVMVILDGPALVTGLDISSNTTLLTLAGCGLYLADGSDRALLRNANRSRGAITDHDVAILGGRFNGNRAGQTGAGSTGHQEADETFMSGMQFFGVSYLTLRDVDVVDTEAFGVNIGNADHVTVDGYSYDWRGVGTPHTSTNQDGLHLNGPITDAYLANLRGTSNDDFLALCAGDDSTADMTSGPGLNAQGPYVGQGPITDLIVDGIALDNCLSGIRMLTHDADSRIDRVQIRNVTGSVVDQALLITTFGVGDGSVGHVEIDGFDVVADPSTGSAEPTLIQLDNTCENLVLRNIAVQQPADDRPFIWLRPTAVYDSITIDGLECYDVIDNGAGILPIKIDGHVKRLRVAAVNWVRFAPAAQATTLIAFDDAASQCDGLFLDGIQANGVDHIVSQTDGSIASIQAAHITHQTTGSNASFETSETIDSLTLSNYLTDDGTPASGAFTTTAGDAFTSTTGGGGLVLLEQHTASSSASLDFTAAIDGTFDEYVIEFLNVTPATNAAELQMRVSTDGGATFDATAGRYYHNSSRVSGATWTAYGSGGAATSLGLAHNVSNGAPGLGVSGSIRVLPTGSAQRWAIGQLHYLPNAADRTINLVNGDYENGSYDAIRFLFSAGNIASGTIRVYGVAK